MLQENLKQTNKLINHSGYGTGFVLGLLVGLITSSQPKTSLNETEASKLDRINLWRLNIKKLKNWLKPWIEERKTTIPLKSDNTASAKPIKRYFKSNK